ncbi:MAG: hypothetical protein IJ643_08510, partial [Eubacterium sp.]|nr:hypothetical protein [Eubacterium sp.]
MEQSKKISRKVISVLLSLLMVFSCFSGMGLTAYAGTDTYTNLIPTGSEDTTALAGKVVKFNNIDWYIIKDESTVANARTVTLLAKDPISASKFHDSGNVYSNSTVKTYLDGLLTAEGTNSFKDVADAISPVTLTIYKYKSTDVSETISNAKLWLLSKEEANELPQNVRMCATTNGSKWWLRSPGAFNLEAAVLCGDGKVDSMGDGVKTAYGVRPALKLDLSKVTFDSGTKTFAAPTELEAATTNWT